MAALAVPLAAGLVAPPAAAQPGRVAGISVMVTDVRPSGGGREADFDVQVTTLQTTDCECESLFPFYDPPTVGQLGDYTNTFGIAGTYLATTASTYLSETTPYNAGTLRYYHIFRYYATFRGSIYERYLADGALPAIDYGDGQTVPATDLPTLVTSTTTAGGAIRRVFRGSFTHMYADPLVPHTIRVASAPSPYAGPPFTGETVTAAAYPVHLEVQLALDFTVSSASAYSGALTRYHAPGSTTSPVGYSPPNLYGPYPAFSTSTSFTTSTTQSTSGLPAQLVNTALVGALSPLEIPAASTWGLLALAGLLAAAGALALVRR